MTLFALGMLHDHDVTTLVTTLMVLVVLCFHRAQSSCGFHLMPNRKLPRSSRAGNDTCLEMILHLRRCGNRNFLCQIGTAKSTYCLQEQRYRNWADVHWLRTRLAAAWQAHTRYHRYSWRKQSTHSSKQSFGFDRCGSRGIKSGGKSETQTWTHSIAKICKVHVRLTDFLTIFSGGCHAKQCSDIGIVALASRARGSTSRKVGWGLCVLFAGRDYNKSQLLLSSGL